MESFTRPTRFLDGRCNENYERVGSTIPKLQFYLQPNMRHSPESLHNVKIDYYNLPSSAQGLENCVQTANPGSSTGFLTKKAMFSSDTEFMFRTVGNKAILNQVFFNSGD